MNKQPSNNQQQGFEWISWYGGNLGLAYLLPLLITLAAHLGVQKWPAISLSFQSLTEPRSVAQPHPSATASFRQAVNTAMSAARLTQFARTPDEWRLVANQWEGAIATLQQIPATAPTGSLAQRKLVEYQQNLNYARRHALGSSNRTLPPELNQYPPGTWLRVATTANQTTIYIDSDSLVRNPPYVAFWQRTIGTSANGQTWIHDQQWVANCQSYQLNTRGALTANPSQPQTSLTARSASLLNALCGPTRLPTS